MLSSINFITRTRHVLRNYIMTNVASAILTTTCASEHPTYQGVKYISRSNCNKG